MDLPICEHPQRVKVDGHWRYVACGKCNTCLNHKASVVVEKLEQETQCHAYCMFVTLTYNDDHLPTAYVTSNYDLVCDDFGHELCISLKDIPSFKASSRLYLARRKNIPFACKYDVQTFLKRFRFYIDNLFLKTPERICQHEKECKSIRYYFVSEYGPSTYRPHYHGLIWFDSLTIAKNFHRLLCKAWSFGYVSSSLVRSGSASSTYVARYINSVSSLPKVYLHKDLRPFSLCSKNPSLGTLCCNSEEIQEIFFSGSPERALQRSKQHTVKTSPLWRSLENRLFPKIPGFNKWSHNERITLYSVYRLCPVEGFENFISWTKQIIDDSLVKEYADTPINVIDFNGEFRSNKCLFTILRYLYEADISSEGVYSRYNRLRNLYYVSSRVFHQRVIFGISLDHYVAMIEQYYSHKELFKLSNFYDFQVKFTAKYKTALPLIFAYPDVIDMIRYNWNLPSDRWTKCLSDFLVSLGFDLTNKLHFSVQYSEAQKIYFKICDRITAFNARIVFNNTKTKKRNDYIENINNQSKFNFNLKKHYE